MKQRPLAAPNVEQATSTGIVQAMTPYRRFAKVCWRERKTGTGQKSADQLGIEACLSLIRWTPNYNQDRTLVCLIMVSLIHMMETLFAQWSTMSRNEYLWKGTGTWSGVRASVPSRTHRYVPSLEYKMFSSENKAMTLVSQRSSLDPNLQRVVQ